MVFIPFQKNTKCLVTEDLFLELVWEEGKSPKDDNELLGIIEGLDHQYVDTFQHSIETSLPYLTFFQAEALFQELKETYGHFQLKKVAVCHLEGKEAVSEGEVFASPFIIDRHYQTLLQLLIEAILTEAEFASYSYSEKREYFNNQVYPVYKNSLGIQESALPLFPEEGEKVPLANTHQTSRQVVPPPRKAENEQTISISKPSLNRLSLVIGTLGILTLGSIGAAVFTFSQLAEQSIQLNYLHKELQDTKQLVTSEHQVDVFSRYFLPQYYSGKKEALTAFLSEGDAKYTVPKTGTLQSVILEQMNYDSEKEEYQVAYVLALRQEETTLSVRLSFTVTALESSPYGFVVTTEPIESPYLFTQ
ncbi:TPA: hypothetical protein U1C40_000101 [Streptococcus suis]|nr:hypothetical protein [Streptococcus suis]